MASKISINLDTSKENFLVAKCKQNDDLTLEAYIYGNGAELDLTNKEIIIQALKADNTYIIQNTEIVKENNKILAELDRDFSRVSGTTKIEILLVESGKQNTTFSFYLEVSASVINGAVESSNTVTILENLQNKIVEAGAVKEETEQLISSGGAATTGDIANITAQLEDIILQNGIFANDTLEIQNKINSGENVIGLEANKTYIVNTINIPDNRQITILGWNTYISTSDGTIAFNCGVNSNVKILGCRFNGGRTHSISNSSGRFDWQVYGGLSTLNTPNSTASALDIANFAGQNLTSNIPIGMVFHGYTDGNVFQIDNVGRNNVILTLKNAYNPTRRADKDGSYFGYGDYLRLVESYDDAGVINGREWFKLTKDRKFSWLYGIGDFVQSKIDDGIWAFRSTVTNAHNNIYSLVNGLISIFTITKSSSSKNEIYTFAPSEANTEFIYSSGRKIENINKADDGLYAVQTLIKNEHNYVWQMKNGNNEVLKITKNYTQINQLNLKPVIDLTTVTNNTLFIDGTDGKLKFKDSTGMIKIVNLT